MRQPSHQYLRQYANLADHMEAEYPGNRLSLYIDFFILENKVHFENNGMYIIIIHLYFYICTGSDLGHSDTGRFMEQLNCI